MKAIKLNGKTHEVKEVRGSFTYYINEKKQVKCIESSSVEVVEVEENEITKAKIYKTFNAPKCGYDSHKAFNDRLKIALENETGRTGLTLEQLKSL
jgi:hypothetical protein